jgi:hypothetical protein
MGGYFLLLRNMLIKHIMNITKLDIKFMAKKIIAINSYAVIYMASPPFLKKGFTNRFFIINYPA